MPSLTGTGRRPRRRRRVPPRRSQAPVQPLASTAVRTRSRRRLDVALLCGGGVLLGVGAAIGAFVGNPEHIQDMWAGASFHADGSAAITEVIDWDYGSATDKHG